MTRTEKDLRDALRELERRADDHSAPSTADIVARASTSTPADEMQLVDDRKTGGRRMPRWMAPAAAAAVVAAGAVTVAVLNSGHGDSPQPRELTAANSVAPSSSAPAAPSSSAASDPPASSSVPQPSPSSTAASDPPTSGPAAPPTAAAAATVLDDAAAKLASSPPWPKPTANEFFYVRTTEATTWTSVSGAKPGRARNSDGVPGTVPGCKHGHIVSDGQSGSCTLNDVPHYRGDAPTRPAAWDAYLEHIAPGAKAGGAQGKIIVQVLHGDLISPFATAALLRYTATCPGLRTLDVRPVSGEKLVGVTCTSMSAGSYGLVFDAGSHAYVGFVPVSGAQQSSAAEIIEQTGLVSSLGRRP